MPRTSKEDVNRQLTNLLDKIYKATLNKKLPRGVRVAWDEYHKTKLRYEAQK